MQILPLELTVSKKSEWRRNEAFFLGLYASEFNGVVIWDMKLLKILSSIAQGLVKLRELIIAVATRISMLPSESDAR